MEIDDLHKKGRDRRVEGFAFSSVSSKHILRIGLERSTLTDRAYCAFFDSDGTVTYKGEGKGLDGDAKGKANAAHLSSVRRYLSTLDIDALPDEYMPDSAPFQWGIEFITFYLLVETTTFVKVIRFSDIATPPQFDMILDMLDLILDSASWNKHDFFIQRSLSEKPLRKRKWDRPEKPET